MHVRPHEPPLAGTFRKNPADEAFIGELNEALADFEDRSYRPLDEALPTLHVIGAPRSGTTLLYQLVASGLDVGYVNNLTAAFWRTPLTGLRLAHKLGLDSLSSSFASDFGRTRGVSEPHEFGYFWNHHLGYPDLVERSPDHDAAIDWSRLVTVIVNMAATIGKPMVFKPMLLTWHLESMARHMDRTCYVWIRRERRQTALSLLRMREELFGNHDTWASLKPAVPLDDEPPWRQVAAQVVLIERVIDAACTRLGDGRVLRVDYEDVCTAPMDVLARTRELLGSHGHRPALRIDHLEPFAPQRTSALDAEFGARIDAALEEYEDRIVDGSAH